MMKQAMGDMNEDERDSIISEAKRKWRESSERMSDPAPLDWYIELEYEKYIRSFKYLARFLPYPINDKN